MVYDRPSKDEYYLGIAKAVSLRSPCMRRMFGAIIVVNDTIVSTGYNGPARGSVNCHEIGCIKDIKSLPSYSAYDLCPAVHAEENAVVNAARNGAKVFGGILYIYGARPNGTPTPSHPCDRCKRILINAGIKKVITKDENGKILTYNVSDWIGYDKDTYISRVNEARNAENQNK